MKIPAEPAERNHEKGSTVLADIDTQDPLAAVRPSLSRVVAFINNKGGVGKTTLAANVGGLLATSGWRVLIIDIDPQGNLGLDLGYEGTDQDDDGKAQALALQFGDAIEPLQIRPNLDVIVGGSTLDIVVLSMGANLERRLALASMIVKLQVKNDYDIILLDCPPGNDPIQEAALTAARYMLIPAKTDAGSLKGLTLTSQRIEKIAQRNPDLDLLGIVLFDTGTGSTSVREMAVKEIAMSLRVTNDTSGSHVAERSGEAGEPTDAELEGTRQLIFETFVRHAEASAFGQRHQGVLVHELEDRVRQAPKWYEALRTGSRTKRVGPVSAQNVADDLQGITKEFIERLNAKEAESV